MRRVKLFVRQGCPRCPEAKRLVEAMLRPGVELECYDVDTAHGLAEAAYYGVQSVPSIVVEDEAEEIRGQWLGQVPRPEELAEALE